MMHDFPSKREKRKLPPEKLYEILRGIYPKDIADELFKEFLDSLVKKIDEIVAGDGWNEIPLERLWVRW